MRKELFDCVEMKRKAAKKIYEALKGKAREEQLAYWEERNAEMRRHLENPKKAGEKNHAKSA